MEQVPDVRVLLVEDNAPDATLIQEILSGLPIECHVTTVATLKETKLVVDDGMFDLVILDLVLPNGQAEQAFDCVRAATDMPIVIVSGLGDQELVYSLVLRGAVDYLWKKWLSPARVEVAIRRAMERRIFDERRT